FPQHATLDAVAPKHPVALERIDGHALWVNAAAMRAAGVGRGTPEPPGGRILRDPSGEPTGVLIDRAAELVEAKVPADPAAVRARRILRAADVAVSAGLPAGPAVGDPPPAVTAWRRAPRRARHPVTGHARAV